MDIDSRLTAAAVSWPTMGMGEGGSGTAGWYAGPLAGVQATSSAESEFSAAESSCRQACQSRAVMTMTALHCNVLCIDGVR